MELGWKMFSKLKNCHNSKDFSSLAKQRIPSPIFHYIDGGADDEITLHQNTKSFEKWDLVPNILRGVEKIDTSVSLMGKKINLPLFFSPTALQRLFHYQGERAVGKVAEKFGTFFGISSLATVSIEEIAKNYSSPKMFQLYVHKDKGLNNSMIEKCIENDFDAIAVTVDTIVGGNRERDFYTGFTSPPKLTLSSLISFATHPSWGLNYLLREKFELPQLQSHVKEGTNVTVSIGDYFTSMLDQNINWKTVEEINKKWGKHLCLKGIMSVEDAKKAVDMFKKVNTKVLGVIENMTHFLCPHCNEASQIFPGTSGKKESKRLDVPFLGQIYLSPEIAQSADDGTPYVLKYKDSSITQEYINIASQLIELSEK